METCGSATAQLLHKFDFRKLRQNHIEYTVVAMNETDYLKGLLLNKSTRSECQGKSFFSGDIVHM